MRHRSNNSSANPCSHCFGGSGAPNDEDLAIVRGPFLHGHEAGSDGLAEAEFVRQWRTPGWNNLLDANGTASG